jgi:hypothetical protein
MYKSWDPVKSTKRPKIIPPPRPGGRPSLAVLLRRPVHPKIYTPPKRRFHGPPANANRNTRIALRIQKPPKPPEARKYEPIVRSALPDTPETLSKPVKLAWLEMNLGATGLQAAIGSWWRSETLMAAYLGDKLQPADTSLLIGLLNKISFPPRERGRLNIPEKPGGGFAK